MRIHQYVDSVVQADAISNYALQIQDLLKDEGFDSKIYTRANFTGSKDIIDYGLPINKKDYLIFHHSTYSPLVEKVASLPNKKMIIYHNITPSGFFRQFDYSLYKIFREAERQNNLLRKVKFEAAVGDSKYNLSLLKKYVKKARVNAVLPPFLKLQFTNNDENNEKSASKSANGRFNIIFVGRFVSNKKQDELIKLFEYYHNFINPNSRLVLVGRFSIFEPYCSLLSDHILKRELNSVQIVPGSSSDALKEYYQESNLFLSMSEHEGFCVPVIEALHYGVPVLAYDIPAIAELIDKKYLFRKKDFAFIASVIDEIRQNQSLREKMLKEQKKILNRFGEKKLEKNFLRVLKKTFHL